MNITDALLADPRYASWIAFRGLNPPNKTKKNASSIDFLDWLLLKVWSNPSLSLLPGPFCAEVIAPVMFKKDYVENDF